MSGEEFITTDSGKEVRFLFNNRALAAVEERLKKGVIIILNEMIMGQTGVGELVQILRFGMEAATGQKITLDEAYAVMDEVGYIKLFEPISTAISKALGYKERPNEKSED